MLPAQLLALRNGDSYVNKYYPEEEVADATLAADRRGAITMAERTEYLSREQMALRRSKEVNPTSGIPEGRLRQGLYRRTYNPNLGSRPRGLKQGDD